jgi:hypothetical protein
MHEHVTIREINDDLGGTSHILPGIYKGEFCIPEELYVHQVWQLQEAMTLLILPSELDDFDLVIHLNIGSLRLLNLLATFTPNDPGSRREDSQAGRHGGRFWSGLQ